MCVLACVHVRTKIWLNFDEQSTFTYPNDNQHEDDANDRSRDQHANECDEKRCAVRVSRRRHDIIDEVSIDCVVDESRLISVPVVGYIDVFR